MIINKIKFPDFTGLKCNMMPFIQGDPSSLPEEYKSYFDIINENYIETGGKEFWGSMGAGVLPICTTTGRILLAQRSGYVQEPYTWSSWGGKIDDHETNPKEAALREFNEETQHSGSMNLLEAYIYKHGDFTYYDFIGLLDKEFQPKLNWETSRAEWVSYDELLKLNSKHFGLHALIKNSGDLIQKYCNINQENNG